jgi:hypothetical protein
VYLASGGAGEGTPGKPLLMIGGTGDGIATPASLEAAFERKVPGKRYLSIRDAGHLAFADICVIGRERGGVLKIAVDHGLEVSSFVQTLSTDGCVEGEDLPVEEAWPIIDHTVTAELRAALGVDAQPKGLGPSANGCFGDRVVTYRAE